MFFFSYILNTLLFTCKANLCEIGEQKKEVVVKLESIEKCESSSSTGPHSLTRKSHTLCVVPQWQNTGEKRSVEIVWVGIHPTFKGKIFSLACNLFF